ncbi:hypothetical protein QBC46DRAFT_391469 [Diplogelasinospora grovesii]|uniref:Uncharacterized protein n=1 Tax=Diplogelasinospora grovesii TaxID=303347 RepID=A0AAN6N544_9PEZI|nr:hypothetical protein QBC46DRAFT_391469 [Diplogelasinospora grovesii]
MATCKACQEPLTLTLDPADPEIRDGGEEAVMVPDDLELQACGCHFHWQCLLDVAPQVTTSMHCPACDTSLASGHAGSSSSASSGQTILTNYASEDGVQQDYDILSVLREEAYFAQHPEDRSAKALHIMSAEGDVAGIMDVLMTEAEDAEELYQAAPVQRLTTWRDPLNGGQTALHVAIVNRQEDVFWLLLWVATPGVPETAFPAEIARRANSQVILSRMKTVYSGQIDQGGMDVRFVRDDNGRTPGDLCREVGSPFSDFAQSAVFQ